MILHTLKYASVRKYELKFINYVKYVMLNLFGILVSANVVQIKDEMLVRA